MSFEKKVEDLFGKGVMMDAFKEGWREIYDFLQEHSIDETKEKYGEALLGIARTSIIDSNTLAKETKEMNTFK